MRTAVLAFVVCLAAGNYAAVVKNGFKGYKVHRLSLQTQQQLDFLVLINNDLQNNRHNGEIEFWTDSGLLSPNVDQPVLVMVSPVKEREFLHTMDQNGIKHEVTIPDLAKAIEVNQKMGPEDQRAAASGRMTWTAYHNYATIEAHLNSLTQQYPNLIQSSVIGQSYEGRNIYLLKIGNPRADGKTKPAIWMDSQIHAREWIASATLTFMINKLVTEYASNSTSRRMLDEVDWYVVPVINADGFEFTKLAGNRMWRKTRRVNPFSSDTGADPNRNYDHKWMYAGANQSPYSDIYAGAYPFSEVENLWITDAALAHKDQIKTLLTFHSAAEMWLLPWGYDSSTPSDFEELRTMGVRATNALRALYGIRYDVGSSTQLLGAAAGATDDWGKAKGMFKYAVTVELRDQGYGFVLPPAQIIPSGLETFEAINVVAQMIYAEYGPTLD